MFTILGMLSGNIRQNLATIKKYSQVVKLLQELFLEN